MPGGGAPPHPKSHSAHPLTDRFTLLYLLFAGGYLVAYSMTWGSQPWLCACELVPLRLHAVGPRVSPVVAHRVGTSDNGR